MSTMIMGRCWPLQLPPTAKAVLISLADNANDSGVCWPSIPTIAMRTCFSERAVSRAIQLLEKRGLVVADRSNGRHTFYHLKPPSESHPRHIDAAAPATPNPRQRVTQPPSQVPSNRKEPSRTARIDIPAREPSAAALACIAMREAGVDRVNPSNPDLLELIAAGVTTQEFGDTARELPGKGFPYILTTIRNRRAEPRPPPVGNGAPPERRSRTRQFMDALGEKLDALDVEIQREAAEAIAAGRHPEAPVVHGGSSQRPRQLGPPEPRPATGPRRFGQND